MSTGWAFIDCDDLPSGGGGGGASVDTSRDPLPATIGTANVDFTNFGQIYYGTLTGDVTITPVNPILFHTVILEATGDFQLNLDPSIENFRGVYTGTKDNIVVIKCVDTVAPKYFSRIYARTP